MISQIIRSALEKNLPLIFLDSSKKDHADSNISYLAIGVSGSISVFGAKIVTESENSRIEQEQNAWDALQSFRAQHSDAWLFGYFGYDLKNYSEDLGSKNFDAINAPDAFLFKPQYLLRINLDEESIDWMVGEQSSFEVIRAGSAGYDVSEGNLIQESEYKTWIQEARALIREGDFYEINLSHQIEYKFDGDAFELYQAMRALGPVPFGAFMNLGEIKVSCLSPERFLKKEGRKLISQPIKGTRGRNEDGDSESEIRSLIESEKERAENLMIVDLVRNDLSRVSKPGSVKVSNLFEIQSFETVHQMVSTVESIASEEVSEIEIVKSCFPMGSMTGAPKISAMKVIDDLENYKRGIYSGAIGYFDPEGNFDFNVVIRTAIQKGDKLYYSVGGAITSDSDPQNEWDETLVKARALTEVKKTILD